MSAFHQNHHSNIRSNVIRHLVRFNMSISNLLLKFQLWVMQNNVSDLKKRFLFFSALLVYGLALSMLFIINYFDPASELRKMQNPVYSIVYISLLLGLMISLISMGFVYICRSVGITNLYSSMLFLGVLDTFRSVFFEDPLQGGSVWMFFLHMAVEFGSVVAVAWLSLRLNCFFSLETPSFKLGYQLGYLVGRVFRFLRIW